MPSRDLVVFDDVRFAYDSAAPPLFGGALRFHAPRGFTGIVGPNGAGKSTVLLLAVGALDPESGHVRRPARAVYAAQRTDEPPDGLEALLGSCEPAAIRLRDQLGLGPAWTRRAAAWGTLSHGERKRLQIGAALLEAPDLLALDEPTNHVDAPTREALERVLRGYRGIGLLVSHDRALLDALCSRCLFLGEAGAVLRPGGYTEGCREAARERESAARARETARAQLGRLAREAAARRGEAARSDRRRSKRGLDPKDHDGRGRIDLARVSGKDGAAGRALRQLEGRLRQAEARLDARRAPKERRLGIALPAERARGGPLAAIGPDAIPLGGDGAGRRLHVPALALGPGDRVAVTGPNGAGKTTLLRHLLAAARLAPEQVTLVPQEIPADDGRAILREVRGLGAAERGALMTIVSRLGSRPAPLLASDDPSPGELRKLLLALGMRRTPRLVAMDEPTNHLDLPSIECLEEALAELPCALVLVSHDRRFLARLATREWRVEPVACAGAGEPDSRLEVRALAADEAGPADREERAGS